MNRPLPALMLAFILAGCSSFPFLASRNPVHELQTAIDQVLADTIFIPSRASLKVVSLKSGEVVYEREAKSLIRPASNMKLLTSAAALHYLGTGFRYRTLVLADTLLPDGSIPGSLFLKGYGNPDLTTNDLDTMARRLYEAGIRTVAGDVVGDASYLDDEYWGTGWMWDDEPDSDAPFLSALTLNDNCITVHVRPGTAPGDPLSVVTDPPTSYVTIQNNGRTVRDSVVFPLKVSRLFKDRLNTITISGDMVPDTARKRDFKLTVWKPELYLLQVFRERLALAGIGTTGAVRLGTVPPTSRLRFEHLQPIDSTIINLNKISDNLSADLTLKIIDAETRGTPGSAAGGVTAVRRFLSSLGIDTTAFLMVDGSGLSHYNLVTAEILNRLLVGMHGQAEIFPLFYESLPIAGVDGTIRTRMRNTPAAGNLRAKTGSISGVSSLSGYVTTRDGEMLAFSMAMQNFILPTSYYRNAQDKIGALLAGFSRNGDLP